MSAVLAVAGALLVAVAVADAVITTLAAGNGGGPLTRRLARWTWQALRRASSGGASPLLSGAGAAVLLVTVLTWVALLWGGWALILSSSDGAVLDASTSSPAAVAARIYFAGFVVFTLGVGDFVPGTGLWQVLTALASFLGLFVVTLAITYLVSVVSAAVTRRALARSIHLSGSTGVEIVRRHWDGDGTSSGFDSLAQTWTTQVLQMTQQHLAYPVLHHFHARDDASSAPRALAALDDAVVLLTCGVRPGARPGHDTLARLQGALEHYASTIGSGDGRREPPPAPALDRLRGTVAVVPDPEYAAASAAHRDRRRRLASLVEADAWDWPHEPGTAATG